MQDKNFKFVFFGTPDVASKTLEILKESGFLPSLIVTATDKPQGRKMLLTPPPAKVWAIENNTEYIQPEKFDEEVIQKLRQIEATLFIVVAYGKILKEEIINMPTLGSVNIHYSLLPKYRGASPVESAILNGDKITGVSIQQMEYKMDSGPLIATVKTKIEEAETAPELRKRLIQIGGDLLCQMLPKIINKEISTIPQDEDQATFCKKIKKEDGLVDIEKDKSIEMYNKYRAYKAWPRIFYFKDNKRVIITEAVLHDEKFIIKKIIPEGGKEQMVN
ncbi:MAG: methionyl-tRNA formyltransferase [Candidatus Paceibacterota bacterium]